jgi:hypothetical protein
VASQTYCPSFWWNSDSDVWNSISGGYNLHRIWDL